MKRWLKSTAVSIFILLIFSTGLIAEPKEDRPNDRIKNVIMMIPDGMSVGGIALTRWVKGGKLFPMDGMYCGLIRTYNCDTPFADSAPAGTAMSCGFKSHTGYIGCLGIVNIMPGVLPLKADESEKPVANLMEAARKKGMRTGIVVTCETMHATPADYTSHYIDRQNFDVLGEQQLYCGLDVMMGGGYTNFTKNGRADGKELIPEISALGYTLITNTAGLRTVSSPKVWGLFNQGPLNYDIDRDTNNEPSLADMTIKALDLLSKSTNGFILMVEGSQIDWAAHANDPMAIISEISSFEKAVSAALDFAQKDGSTIVVVAPDHGNSGISIGNAETTKGYDTVPLLNITEPFLDAHMTGQGIDHLLGTNREDAAIVKALGENYGIHDLTAMEKAQIQKTQPGLINTVIGPMLAKRAYIGFTTGGHTGEDVILGIYSPDGDRLTGLVENTDIARYIERKLDLDLAGTSRELFVDAVKEFESLGAVCRVIDTNSNSIALSVKKGKREMVLPVSKNFAYIDGEKTKLDGVIIYNGRKWYVSRKTVGLMQ